MPRPPVVADPRIATLDHVANAVDRVDEATERRSLRLRTTRTGPYDLLGIDDHVQGVTRIDHAQDSTLAVTASGERHGVLWLATFGRETVTTASGKQRERLSAVGHVHTELRMPLPHPGGIQACGDLLAVASESPTDLAQLDLYDLSDPRKPQHVSTLVLNGALGEPMQKPRSKAGFVAMTQLAPGSYLLFVGGRSYAQHEGWFYRFERAQRHWAFVGAFTGKPISKKGEHAWGPQDGAALLVEQGGEAFLIALGTKDDHGNDEYRERIRCFALERDAGPEPIVLVQEPREDPQNYSFRASLFPLGLAPLFFRRPGIRWGSTAYADARGDLVFYVTARNPLPAMDGIHDLEIVEMRAKPR